MTIKDIARMANVSTATVSRVINSSGYVSEKTRARVLAVIEATNFKPNAVARSLITNLTKMVAVIVPDLENEFFAKVIAGISHVAKKHGYTAATLSSFEHPTDEVRLLDTIMRQRVDGLLMTPVSEHSARTADMLAQVRRMGVPVVLIDRDIAESDFSGVFVDNFDASYEAVGALIENGHQQIAIVTGPYSSTPGRERTEGYKRALADRGMSLNPAYVIPGNFKWDGGYRAAEAIFAMPGNRRPTAVFLSNNLTSIGFLQYMMAHDLQPGRDIALIGFDDIDVLNRLGIPLSVVRRDAYQQGIKAMELLCGEMRVRTARKSPERVMLKCTLVLRGSEK
ncbi:MAG: LacI family DNA-binding transcriptional regulator [Eubacteriales bacterium]|nr:LacI family DNA-binding transcriptional regulator [Eubacteriales bacterium]